MPNDTDPVAYRIIFHGRVQGVGFRYRTCRLAQQFTVSGTVENLPDGTVQMFVEGTQTEIDRYLNSVAAMFIEHITRTQKTAVAVSGAMNGFEILR